MSGHSGAMDGLEHGGMQQGCFAVDLGPGDLVIAHCAPAGPAAEAVTRLLETCQISVPTGPQRIHIDHIDDLDAAASMVSERVYNALVITLDGPPPKAEIGAFCQRFDRLPVVVVGALERAEISDLLALGVQDYIDPEVMTAGALSRAIANSIVRTDLRARIRDKTEAVREMNADLEAFTYIVSHDLRAPLVNLRGFSAEVGFSLDAIKPVLDRLHDQMSVEERALIDAECATSIPNAITFINDSVQHIERMTAAILDFSRAGRVHLRPERLDLNALIEVEMRVHSRTITAAGIQVDISPMPEIDADRAVLERVFANLIDNAVKYLDPGRPGRIAITAIDDPEQIVVSVRDNGCGIAADELGKVFDIFRRASNSHGIHGTGVGMAFARTLVRKLGGRIWCESQEAVGTTFHVALPKDPRGLTDDE